MTKGGTHVPRAVMVLVRMCQTASALFVDAALCRLEPLGIEGLDRVGGARHERLCVVVWLEIREDVVRERARVAALRAADSDPEAHELLCPEVLRDRAQPVVPREPAAEPYLEAAEVQVALVVHHEHRVGVDLEEGG